MKEKSFEIMAYFNGRVGLNVSVLQIYSDFLKEEKEVQLSHLPFSQTLVPVHFSCFFY